MKDEDIAKAVRRAAELTDSVPERVRVAAFGVVLSRLLDDVPTSLRGEKPGIASQVSNPQPSLRSLPEFIAEVRPKKHPQFIVSFAYYHLKSGDERGITTKEIEDAYRQIRQKAPQNISDTIAACVGRARGWLIPASESKDGSKAWIITPRGEEYVDGGFKAS